MEGERGRGREREGEGREGGFLYNTGPFRAVTPCILHRRRSEVVGRREGREGWGVGEAWAGVEGCL